MVMSVPTWLSGYLTISICFIKNLIQLQAEVELYLIRAMKDLQLRKLISSYHMKIGFAVTAVCMYVTLVMYLKYLYAKNEILQHLDTVASDTERMMRNLYTIDRNINSDIQQMQDISC